MGISRRGNSWRVSVTHQGKRVRRDFKSHDEARIFETEATASLYAGRPIDSPNARRSDVPNTFGKMADHVWKLEWSKQKASDHTFNRMMQVIEYFGEDTPLEDITSLDLEQYVLDLRSEGNGPATINRKMAVVTKVFNYAHRHGMVTIKPTAAKQREPDGRMKFFSKSEEQEIIDSMSEDPDAQDFFTVLIDTGMRRGEALGLHWVDIDLHKEQITLPDPDQIKAALPRSIPMTSRVKAIMIRRLGEQYVGEHQGPFPFTGSYLDHAIRRARGEVMDHEAVFHTCRHTFVSRLVQKGVPIVSVKTLAGHRAIQTTMRYAHLAPSNLVDAVKALEDFE